MTMTVPCESTPPLPANTMNGQPGYPPPPNGQMMGGATTITTTVCPGSTSCHQETTVIEPTTSLSMMAPYKGGVPPVATVFANFLEGDLAAAGAILI